MQRTLLVIAAAAEIVLGAAFVIQLPFALALWPFPAMSPLSFLLLGSLLITVAAGTLWPVLMRDDALAAMLGPVYVVSLLPLAIYSLQSGYPIFAGVCLLGVIFGAALWVWAWRMGFRDARPTPGPVRASFGLFLAALIVFGGQMALGRTILPWNVTPQLSVIFGWVFLGGAALFLYGIIRPQWITGAGILASFLVYDLILLGPFVARLPAAAPEHRTNLIIYIAALTYSGLLAIYYLVIDAKTRLWGRGKPETPA